MSYGKRLLCSVMLAGVAFTLGGAAYAQSSESTWDKIQRTKKLLVGCVPDLPYTAVDSTTGEWKGFQIPMAADIAESLGVEWECVSTTWGTAALTLQAGKADIVPVLAKTGEREKIIGFVGPTYNQAYMLVARQGLTGSTWEDFNKADVRVSVVVGTSNEAILKERLPNATMVGLTQQGGSPSLAVTAGRADAFLSSVLTGIMAKGRNPDVGELIFPKPVAAAPNFMGIRKEEDARFSKFLQAWTEKPGKAKQIESWVKQSLLDFGISREAIPEDLHFTLDK